MSKVSKLSIVEMKALLPPMPVLANESQEQFEKFFDQVATTLDVQDPVELILIRDFVWPSWEIARYTRHRVVAFDRKFKEMLAGQCRMCANRRLAMKRWHSGLPNISASAQRR